MYTYIVIVMFFLLGAVGTEAATTSSSKQFSRITDLKIASISANEVFENMTVDTCADSCMTRGECRSFGYDSTEKVCSIYKVNTKDIGVKIQEAKGHDLYELDFLESFIRITNRFVPEPRKVVATMTSVEECARMCLMETNFVCHGFNHIKSQPGFVCHLLEASPTRGSLPAYYNCTVDYYDKKIDSGPMSHFLNFGAGSLPPEPEKNLYFMTLVRVPVENCAQICLDDSRFKCRSFDFISNNELSFCHLSGFSVAFTEGLVHNHTRPHCNHFEKIGRFLNLFHPTMFAKLSESSVKMITNVSPNVCAQKCIEEEDFICRSFDYQVNKDGICFLSPDSATSSQNLLSETDPTWAVHHFEMKPVFECGGNFSESFGSLRSPGWPSQYPSRSDCLWHISAPRNQIIVIKFSHLEFRTNSDCSELNGNHLIITEYDVDAYDSTTNQTKTYCLSPKVQDLTTKTNRVTVRYIANSLEEKNGFQAFFSADWTCNAVLKNGPGEFASPGFPHLSYSPDSRCSWNLWSPNPQLRVRLTVDYFTLEGHSLGHCTEQVDNLKVMDGGTIQSPVIGLYCGVVAPFILRSTGREMMVQFKTFSNVRRSGDNVLKLFHAYYAFEEIDSNITLKTKIIPYQLPKANERNRARDGSWIGHDEDRSSQPKPSIMGEETGDLSTFKHTMWTLVVILLFIVIVLASALFLVAKYHRKQLIKYRGKMHSVWEPKYVSIKFLRSLKKRKNLNDEAGVNNLIGVSANMALVSESATFQDNVSLTEEPVQDTSQISRFCRKFSPYKKLSESNIYVGEENPSDIQDAF